MGNFLESLNRAASTIGDRFLGNLPQLLEAMALLVVGWLLARLLSMATRRGAALIDSLVARTTGHRSLRMGRFAGLLGTLVYWIVLLFFVTAATQSLGLQTFTDWLAKLLDQLPLVVAGFLIMTAGYLLSGFVGNIVQTTATGLAPPQRTALAQVARGAMLVIALLVGADQMGLKVTWLAVFAAVLLVSVLGGWRWRSVWAPGPMWPT